MTAMIDLKRAARSVAAVLALAIGSPAAHAEFKVRYPNIDYREVEIENNSSVTFDRRQTDPNNHDISTPTEIGLGVLPWWFVEAEMEAAKHPGQRTSLDAVTFENYFMLTEPGQYFLDVAIFAEISHSTATADADTGKIGLLLQKEQEKVMHTLNVYIEKQIGTNANDANTFQYAWQTRYRLDTLFQPGVEIYGQIDDLRHPGEVNQQQLRVGPMFAGSYNLGQIGGRGKIKYEAGYLFGVTGATETGTVRTRLEYEVPF